MPPTVPNSSRPPATLAERFWSLARTMDDAGDGDPRAVVAHVLAVLDRLDAGAVGDELTANTLSFLALLRQQELRGDLLYASPEQARGEQMDERSLVFSVGVLLFEKLTGRHPFGAENNPNRLARIRRGEIASGVNYFPRAPAALRAVLLRAMGPFPQDRYHTLDELRAELAAFLAGRPVRAQTVAEPALPESLHAESAGRRARAAGKRAGRRDVLAGYENDFDAPTDLVEPISDHTGTTVKRPPPWLMPVGWSILGGLVASLAFIIAAPVVGRAPLPAASLAISTPLVVSDDADADVDAEAADGSSGAGAPAAADAKDGAAKPAGVAPAAAKAADGVATPAAARGGDDRLDRSPAPTPAADLVFDPDLAGARALDAAHECFREPRLNSRPSFGVSLRFRTDSPLSEKVFFGASGDINSTERRCLMDALVGVSADAAPDRITIVVYSFFVNADGGSYRARVKE